MSTTPLVSPGEYFARADAFSRTRAVGLVIGYWLAITLLGLVWRVGSNFGADSVSIIYLLQTLEATLLYWVVPTAVLYGFGLALGASLEPAETLSLAAWGLVPLLAGELVTNALLSAIVALEVDLSGVPVDPDLWILVPLTLLACAWAAVIWRGGLWHGIGLDRSTATTTALLAAGVCAALLLFPMISVLI
ncbi:YIP1 family protein [Natronorubrum daqingense]|uniref:Yip1 domain-containing protein n=1 Tax=Natronorubrum daqingense TaxID=588898 RepID=A0A1N6Y5X8_9EURY|nr:YIP1 family protein [Natronorubrum daqingense]APX95770.1 hypothetical protein BB347_03585 [Natronorubrum daqingense]SIR09926.1 hypothetical protein SAMN05421809_0326 [Natronorubrum daqingense]